MTSLLGMKIFYLDLFLWGRVKGGDSNKKVGLQVIASEVKICS